VDEREWRATAATVMVAAVMAGALLAWARAPQDPPVDLLAVADGAPAGPGGTALEVPPPTGEGAFTAASGAPGEGDGAEEITVHVAGAVIRPGLVQLPADGRVADAIAAAGGIAGGGDASSVNLAARLVDGSQVVVPAEGGPPGSVGGVGDGLVHVNHADASQLEALPGVGPVLAERIVAHREASGPFAAVEDLLGVPGIGEAKLASLRDLVALP
jgi:competence protein ComEA